MFSSNTDSLGYQSFKGASWALDLGLHLGDTIKGLSLVLGPLFNPNIWACVLGLHAYYFKPHQIGLQENAGDPFIDLFPLNSDMQSSENRA